MSIDATPTTSCMASVGAIWIRSWPMMAFLAAVRPYVSGKMYETGWIAAGRLLTGKLTPQNMRRQKVKMLAKTRGFLKKKQKPPISNPKPAMVNAVRKIATTRASGFVWPKSTPKMKAANTKDIAALRMPSNTWIIALPM